MFDWNDEELTNIIWGEAGEIDDQTVPYQEGSENCHAETAELGKDPENFQNTNEGKEQGGFVDYSWANIGSFDDLDRIFR